MRQFAVLLVLLATLGGAGSAFAVLGGAPDNGAHPYVGAARGGGELCSGFAISSTVFVTAAHCFADGSSVQVTFDESLAGATYVTGTVHNDPAFCFGCGNGTSGTDTGDLAVIVFDEPVALDRYAQLPALGAAADAAGLDVVGYGVQQFDKKTPTDFGTRQVASTDARGAGVVSDEFLKVSSNPGACLGDSGGPDLAPGSDVVLGVTSYGHPNCNGVSYSERLDTQAALDFVSGFLQ